MQVLCSQVQWDSQEDSHRHLKRWDQLPLTCSDESLLSLLTCFQEYSLNLSQVLEAFCEEILVSVKSTEFTKQIPINSHLIQTTHGLTTSSFKPTNSAVGMKKTRGFSRKTWSPHQANRTWGKPLLPLADGWNEVGEWATCDTGWRWQITSHRLSREGTHPLVDRQPATGNYWTKPTENKHCPLSIVSTVPWLRCRTLSSNTTQWFLKDMQRSNDLWEWGSITLMKYSCYQEVYLPEMGFGRYSGVLHSSCFNLHCWKLKLDHREEVRICPRLQVHCVNYENLSFQQNNWCGLVFLFLFLWKVENKKFFSHKSHGF